MTSTPPAPSDPPLKQQWLQYHAPDQPLADQALRRRRRWVVILVVLVAAFILWRALTPADDPCEEATKYWEQMQGMHSTDFAADAIASLWMDASNECALSGGQKAHWCPGWHVWLYAWAAPATRQPGGHISQARWAYDMRKNSLPGTWEGDAVAAPDRRGRSFSNRALFATAAMDAAEHQPCTPLATVSNEVMGVLGQSADLPVRTAVFAPY